MRISYLWLISCLCVGFSPFTQAEMVQVQQGDITLNAELTLADGKSLTDADMIMMVHGTLAHAKMDTLNNLQAVLNEYGYNVLSINLSLGVSDRPMQMFSCEQVQTHRHTDALTEIKTWLQWLSEQQVSQVVLLGHSRGGNQVAWFALEHAQAEAVAALVLLAPMTQQETLLTEAQQATLAKAEALISAGRTGATLSDIPLLHCLDTIASAESVLSYYPPAPKMHTPNLLPELQLPILVVTGSEDQMVTNLLPSVQILADQHFNIHHLEVMDADHFFRDLYAYDIADAIQDFLAHAAQ